MLQKGRAGVSLLMEALLGIGLFGSVMLIVFSLFPATHGSITQARRYTEAVNLAREAMELERAKGFQNPPAPTPGTLLPLQSVVDGVTVVTTYNVLVTDTILGAGSPDERLQITVVVRWTEGSPGGALTRQVQLESIVAAH